MNKTILIAALVCAFYSPVTHAEPVPELVGYFNEQIQNLDRAVNLAQPVQVDQEWFLRRFWLRIRPRVSFVIPGLFKLEIVPETELLWQRELPEGWTTYKPQ